MASDNHMHWDDARGAWMKWEDGRWWSSDASGQSWTPVESARSTAPPSQYIQPGMYQVGPNQWRYWNGSTWTGAPAGHAGGSGMNPVLIVVAVLVAIIGGVVVVGALLVSQDQTATQSRNTGSSSSSGGGSSSDTFGGGTSDSSGGGAATFDDETAYAALENTWNETTESNRTIMCSEYLQDPDAMWEAFNNGADLFSREQFDTFYGGKC